MKSTFLALIITIFTTVAYGQNPVTSPSIKKGAGRVTGKITDSLTKASLEYATVALSETTASGATTSVITDASGNFKIENLAYGTYKVAISYIGYPIKKLNSIILAATKPTLELGTIPLAGGARSLQEVQVVGEVPLIENKIDKLVYNVEKDITASGGTSYRRARKSPIGFCRYER
jgi:hypothetical protein